MPRGWGPVIFQGALDSYSWIQYFSHFFIQAYYSTFLMELRKLQEQFRSTTAWWIGNNILLQCYKGFMSCLFVPWANSVYKCKFFALVAPPHRPTTNNELTSFERWCLEMNFCWSWLYDLFTASWVHTKYLTVEKVQLEALRTLWVRAKRIKVHFSYCKYLECAVGALLPLWKQKGLVTKIDTMTKKIEEEWLH